MTIAIMSSSSSPAGLPAIRSRASCCFYRELGWTKIVTKEKKTLRQGKPSVARKNRAEEEGPREVQPNREYNTSSTPKGIGETSKTTEPRTQCIRRVEVGSVSLQVFTAPVRLHQGTFRSSHSRPHSQATHHKIISVQHVHRRVSWGEESTAEGNVRGCEHQTKECGVRKKTPRFVHPTGPRCSILLPLGALAKEKLMIIKRFVRCQIFLAFCSVSANGID